MSWSHYKSGLALDVARELELEGENVQQSLGNAGEKALHARILALLVVACHETKEHHVAVEASGHFDGKHNHLSVKFDGVDTTIEKVDVEKVTPKKKTK